ncbi:MAG: DUF21 domain-containing protein [Planctomycetes bacterium]|nr:DUF21 domain-containing protein [Planctomycetota bacterium]
MALLVFYVVALLSVSFLCSMLEATLLSVRVYSLMARKEAGDAGAALLLDLKEHRIDDSISAILTLNTIANTLGAALAGAQAATVFGGSVGLFSGVLAFIVLSCTEIVPKTIGTVHAGHLVGFAGRTIHLMTLLLKPVLVVTRGLTGAIARGTKRSVSRDDLRALVSLADTSGSLGESELRVLYNILQCENILIEDVMTPRTVVKTLPPTATLGDLLDDPEARAFSRIPLCGESKDEVIGYVLAREVLVAALQGAGRAEPLARHARSVRYVPVSASLAKALDLFLERTEQLTLAVDEFGGVSGVVTIEDLLEAILGAEIVDEKDEGVDLRKAAADVRNRRLARMSRQSSWREGSEHAGGAEAGSSAPSGG